MTVSVTVLGSSGTHPSPGRVCSGYLIQAEGYRLLLDAGNGSLSNLPCDVSQLDAVIISHLHPDHCVDLFGLYFALRFHTDGPRSVDVHAPAGAQAHLQQLLPGEHDAAFGTQLAFHAAAAGDALELGPLRVGLHAANHPVETVASRVEVGDRVIAFSGDSGESQDLVDCARGADLFICDSSWLAEDGPYPPGLHLTGAQAGHHASAAGAARLLVTHVYPSNRPEEVAAEAARTYDGQVLIAHDRQEHTL